MFYSCRVSRQPSSRVHTRAARDVSMRQGSPDSSSGPSRPSSRSHGLANPSGQAGGAVGPSSTHTLRRQYTAPFVDIASTSSAAGPVVVQHRGPEGSGGVARQASHGLSSTSALSSERSLSVQPSGPPLKKVRSVEAPSGGYSLAASRFFYSGGAVEVDWLYHSILYY
jgi:hypothetical protein